MCFEVVEASDIACELPMVSQIFIEILEKRMVLC